MGAAATVSACASVLLLAADSYYRTTLYGWVLAGMGWPVVRDEVEAWSILWFRLWMDDAGRGAIDGWTGVQEDILSVLPQD